MSTLDQTRSRVRQFVQETFLYMRPDITLHDDDRLLERGIVDSLGMMELLEFIERELQVIVADADITEENLGSVNAIAAYVTKA